MPDPTDPMMSPDFLGTTNRANTASQIAANLRQFVTNADQRLSGLECEYLIQAAQFLERLNERDGL
jgi:hypothetical protein